MRGCTEPKDELPAHDGANRNVLLGEVRPLRREPLISRPAHATTPVDDAAAARDDSPVRATAAARAECWSVPRAPSASCDQRTP
jgi:hypothetical protein